MWRKQLGRLAYADRTTALSPGGKPTPGAASQPADVGQVFESPRARASAETCHLFRRQIGRVAQVAGSKRQPSRAGVRRPRLSYMLSPNTGFRIVGQALARRCHESLAEWLKAVAPCEGPEGRESGSSSLPPICSEDTRCNVVGEHVAQCAEKVRPRGARRWFKPLVHKGVGLDPRVVCHFGRAPAKATPLIDLERGQRCRDSLVNLAKALLHPTVERSAPRVGTRR